MRWDHGRSFYGDGMKNRKDEEILRDIRVHADTKDQIVESIEEIWLSRDDELKQRVLLTMLRSDLWFWLPAVEHILGLSVSERTLSWVVRELSRCMDRELASQIYWENLARASAESPKAAMAQLDVLLKDERIHSVFASMMLSGIFRTCPDEAISMVSRLISRDDHRSSLVGLGAARIILKEEEGRKEELSLPILSVSLPTDPETQSIYSMCLRMVHPVSPQEVECRFLNLYSASPVWVRAQISYDLSVTPGVSDEVRERIEGRAIL